MSTKLKASRRRVVMASSACESSATPLCLKFPLAHSGQLAITAHARGTFSLKIAPPYAHGALTRGTFRKFSANNRELIVSEIGFERHGNILCEVLPHIVGELQWRERQNTGGPRPSSVGHSRDGKPPWFWKLKCKHESLNRFRQKRDWLSHFLFRHSLMAR